MNRELTAAFWRQVDRSGPCWLWTGRRDGKGYGKMAWEGRELMAHRLAFEISSGSLLPGFGVFHRCDTPLCVRPSHLWTGTQAENIRDCQAKGRLNRNKGADHGQAKLSVSKVVRLRDLRREQGTKLTELGRLFGIGATQVKRIVSRKHWRHVA